MVSPRRAAVGQRDSDGEREEPEVVRVWMLGGFRVSVGERTIEEDEWRLRKAANLVKLLALASHHRLHREQAMDLLWPNLDQEAQANNLHQALHAARQTLASAPSVDTSRYLRLQGEQLALCPDGPLWVDVEAFEEAVATARRTLEPTAYRAAMDLYVGDLLPEDRYEAWAGARREELQRAHLALLIELAGLYEERGELGPAIEALGRVVAAEPAHEEVHAGLMRLYALSGQRHWALGQYEQLREALREELDSEPDAASRRLHGEIVAERFPVAPPPPAGQEDTVTSPRPPRNNLPGVQSSFVGREREMVEVKRLLAMTHLLTLTGSGGCGKTRLALEVASDLVGAYPDGVWLVELAALSDPELVPQAVAAVLKVREEPNRPLTATLVDALRSKQMLIVLDNCEHLIEACARLADALPSSCPRLRILATSREALGVVGEANWPVPPLTVPDAQDPPTIQGLTRYEAVQLFLERARSRLPTFALTPENAGAVAKVCRKLDGIPLAIELATGRVTVLAMEQIAQRLEDSLKLLTGGSRTAAPRQQTLRATLDWSYELLSEPEQRLFGRLSVFAGGWTLEAAEAVGAGNGIEEGAVLDLLGRLVDKSLVVAEASPGEEGTLRYRMLEPIRQYGLEQLQAGGEANAVRRRHAAYFLALAEEAEPELRERGAWLERLKREHGNLRGALQWALDPENTEEPEVRAELGLRLATALAQGRFWSAYSLSEGLGWLERGLAGSSTSPASVRAKALNEAGYIVTFQGDLEKGIALLEESLALFKELGDEPGIAASLTQLGYVVIHRRDHERVEALREEAEALRRELADRGAVARVLTFLGAAAMDRNDHEQLVALFEESLVLFRELGDMRGISMCLFCIGMSALEQGDLERAAALLEETLRVLQKLRDKVGTVYSLLGMAGVASSRGEPARAARLWGAAEALGEAIAFSLSPFDRSHYDYEGHLANARSLLDEAAWEAAWAEGRAMTPEQAIEYALGTGECPMVSAPQEESPVASGQPVALTRREKEVARLVAREYTNRQIAAELAISERTVEGHVGKILKKLGLASRNQIPARIPR